MELQKLKEFITEKDNYATKYIKYGDFDYKT